MDAAPAAGPRRARAGDRRDLGKREFRADVRPGLNLESDEIGIGRYHLHVIDTVGSPAGAERTTRW